MNTLATEQLFELCPCPLLALHQSGQLVCGNRSWHDLSMSEPGLLNVVRKAVYAYQVESHHNEFEWRQRWFKVTVSSAPPELLLIALSDITELKKRERHALHSSMHDPLTGIFNRRAFRSHAEALMGEHRGALILLDLDQFKQINDTHGHGVGDTVLVYTASRLRSMLKEGDLLARWGGDEFIAFLPNTSALNAAEVRQRLLSTFSYPYVIGELSLPLAASAGLVVLEPGELGLDSAIMRADALMYENKASRGLREADSIPPTTRVWIAKMYEDKASREPRNRERRSLVSVSPQVRTAEDV